MLIMCVQVVNNKKLKSCLSHTNLKREKELSHTVSLLEVSQKLVQKPY